MKTKEKIVVVALKLFVEQGIDRTSTAQICKEVGIASGSLFVHFKTKQDLIDHIYLERKKAALAHVSSFVDPEATVHLNVLSISKAMVDYYQKNYDDFLFAHAIEKGPQLSKKAQKLYKEESAQSAQIVKSWQEAGELKSLDNGLLKDLWWNMLSAFIRRRKSVAIEDLEIVWDALKK